MECPHQIPPLRAQRILLKRMHKKGKTQREWRTLSNQGLLNTTGLAHIELTEMVTACTRTCIGVLPEKQTTLKGRSQTRQQITNTKTISLASLEFLLSHNVKKGLFFFNLTHPLCIYYSFQFWVFIVSECVCFCACEHFQCFLFDSFLFICFVIL